VTLSTSIATQHDIAVAADVSQSAVSRVFSGGRVAAETRQRVLEAAQALGYRRDPIARSLVTGQTTIVAFVIGDIHNPFYPYALGRASEAFSRAGKQILLFTVPRGGTVDDVLPEALSYRVSGVIVASAELTSAAAQMCEDHGVPLVLFNRYVAARSAPGVTSDNRAGGRTAADHLLAQGRSNFAYVGGLANTSTNRDRRRGFTERLKRGGHQTQVALDKEYSYEWGYEAAAAVLEHSQVDAAFCGNDIIAMGLMDGLRIRGGRKIPDDIAVVGFDDIPAAAWPSYSLTTIQQPVDTMLKATLDILDAPGDERVRDRLQFVGPLIVRNSTAGAPTS
jgi:DNA-binding LacI/PurR family transcriptional regulator